MGGHDAVYRKREQARLKYKPDRIRWLFLVESPPLSPERYFYFEEVESHDHLFIETIRSLDKVLDIGSKDMKANKRELLEQFRNAGFYLMFAIDQPISIIFPWKIRVKMVMDKKDEIIARMKELDLGDAKVILVKQSVYPLAPYLKDEGFNVINDGPIPFPCSGRQAEYREAVSHLIMRYK